MLIKSYTVPSTRIVCLYLILKSFYFMFSCLAENFCKTFLCFQLAAANVAHRMAQDHANLTENASAGTDGQAQIRDMSNRDQTREK